MIEIFISIKGDTSGMAFERIREARATARIYTRNPINEDMRSD